MTRPRIAISCDLAPAAPAKITVHLAYVDYVTRAGGSAMVLPPVRDSLAWLDIVDGVLLVGGDDYRCGVATRVPADFVPVDERREEHDLLLARELLARDIPVLGVCGGFQLLALVAGGQLCGDLPTEGPPSTIRHRRSAASEALSEHPVRWRGESTRHGVGPAGTYTVNSHHHQAVSALPPGWELMAEAEDGVFEAAAGPGEFQVGVQWHPERAAADCVLSDRVARAFLAAAADYQRRRATQ
ncbi:MAG: gamma-glutamyl-gamma-aminobutyrate hydrolase family protein [Planctomycetota bacterium]